MTQSPYCQNDVQPLMTQEFNRLRLENFNVDLPKSRSILALSTYNLFDSSSLNALSLLIFAQ